MDRAVAERSLNSSALRVYAYLFIKNTEPLGVRQVQRAVGFASPSSALYQLTKLMEMGLIEKTRHGSYIIREREKIGILSDYAVVGGTFVPWMLVDALVVSLLSVAALLYFIVNGTIEVIVALTPSAVSSIIMWYEALRSWSSRPVFASS
jgi:hypothetical protein